MRSHTRTPWRVSATSGGSGEIISGDDDGFVYVAKAISHNVDANAAHIVACVNAHDDLVAALAFLLDDIDHDRHPIAVEQAKAALKKVGAL